VFAVLLGCDGGLVVERADEPPVARLQVTTRRTGPCGAYSVGLQLDASGSSDDWTPVEQLEARWDMNGDGLWETGFQPTSREEYWEPRRHATQAWTVICEVRDSADQRAKANQTLDLGPVAEPPDLSAWELTFARPISFASVDTLHVNEPFFVSLWYACSSGSSDWSPRVEFYREGQFIHRSTSSCVPSPFSPCEGTGIGNQSISEPGIYEFRAVLDPDDEIAETNETNNEASATLVIVE
jgi:hypothetical protein